MRHPHDRALDTREPARVLDETRKLRTRRRRFSSTDGIRYHGRHTMILQAACAGPQRASTVTATLTCQNLMLASRISGFSLLEQKTTKDRKQALHRPKVIVGSLAFGACRSDSLPRSQALASVAHATLQNRPEVDFRAAPTRWSSRLQTSWPKRWRGPCMAC
jgi:hypothetical protein